MPAVISGSAPLAFGSMPRRIQSAPRWMRERRSDCCMSLKASRNFVDAAFCLLVVWGGGGGEPYLAFLFPTGPCLPRVAADRRPVFVCPGDQPVARPGLP